MFGKKTKVQAILPPVDYTKWSEDLGFLFFIIEKEKKLMKTLNLNVLNEQLDNKSYLNSSDITKFIDSSINNIIEKLSDKYISFLVEKYFRNRDELIAFITE